MLDFSSLWFIHFVTGSMYLFLPFTYFAHPPPQDIEAWEKDPLGKKIKKKLKKKKNPNL